MYGESVSGVRAAGPEGVKCKIRETAISPSGSNPPAGAPAQPGTRARETLGRVTETALFKAAELLWRQNRQPQPDRARQPRKLRDRDSRKNGQ